MLENYESLLPKLAEEYGLAISNDLFRLFDKYATLLVDCNTHVNLTAITDPEGIAIKHFLDSMLLLKAIDLPIGARLIDIGAGAGFPGLPCKLYRNDLDITLLDSLNKRIAFLNTLSAELEVKLTAIHGRAEEFGQKSEYREAYDVATARAVARLPELCEYCLPFVKKGGYFLAMKGSDAETEAAEAEKAITLLGGKLEKTVWFKLPDSEESKRGIIVIKKISQTPTKYPRNAGQMKKKPL